MQVSTSTQSTAIHFNLVNDAIEWSLQREGVAEATIRVEYSNGPDRFYLGRALLNSAKSIFYNLFPISSELDFRLSDNLSQNRETYEAVSQFVLTLRQTNKLLLEFINSRNIAKSHAHTYFYSPDDHPHLKAIANAIQETAESKIFYEPFFTGWNALERRWGPSNCLPIRELIRLLIEKKVKRFVSVNHYYISSQMSRNEFILPLFKLLGIEYVTYYADPPDGNLSPIEVSAYQVDGVCSYETAAHLHRDWDQINQIKNSKPHATAYFLKRVYEPTPLENNFDILIASHSRIQETKGGLAGLLYIFETSTKDDNLFDDFQIWFMSMRRLLLHHAGLSRPMIETAGQIVYQAYVNGISFLKFLVIDGLKTSRAIRLYGDTGWARLFPNYYQNAYLNDQTYSQFCASRKYMPLLMNASINYLDANPVIHKAIDQGVPYLAFPATVRTADFEGFRPLEYRNLNELNTAIENVNDRAFNAEVLASRRTYIDMISKLFDSLVSDISGPSGYEIQTHPYAVSTREHLKLLDERTLQYIQTNLPVLQDQIQKVFFGRGLNFNIRDSRFSNRAFVSALCADQ